MVSSISSTESLSINQMLKRLDADGDGVVGENELVAERSENISSERAAQIFNNIDWNKDGQLTEGELSATYQLIASDTLAALLDSQSVDSATVTAYGNNLDGEDLETTFSELDQDADGTLTEGEFVLARQSGTAGKATALWEQIVGNSNASRGEDGLTAAEFSVGVTVTREQATEEDRLAAQSVTLNNVKDISLGTVNLGTDNASDLFAQIDKDRDGYIRKADFLAGIPTTVTATQANALWSRIVGNSGNSGGEVLSEDQFSTGYYAVQMTELDSSVTSLDSEAAKEMVTILRNLGVASASANTDSATDDVTFSDPAETFAQIDTDSDGRVTQSDFLNSLSSLSATQANTLWNNIVAHSGTEDTSFLTQEQFVTGYLDRNVELADSSETTTTSISTLNSQLLSLRDSIPLMYDMGTTNPSDMFALLDGNGDGSASYEDFMNARPSTVNADQASATWQAIVRNSGNPSASEALTENEFVVGLENLWGTDLSDEDSASLRSLLDTIDGNTTKVLKAVSNLSDLFSTIDTDSDGAISRDDLISARTSSATEAQATILWRQIVQNAGLSDVNGTINENQFVTGYEAVQPSSLDEGTISRLSDYLVLLENGVSSSENSSSSGSSDFISFDPSIHNPSDLFASADGDADGLISQDDFVASLPWLTSGDASTLWQHIAGNSGNYDNVAILTEAQFVVGYSFVTSDTTSNPSSYATLKQLQTFVDDLRNTAPSSFNMDSLDSESLFDAMDGDQDDLVMRQDFLDNRPLTLSEDVAVQLWDLIAQNSGSDNNGELLTREQFLYGYSATDSSVLIQDDTELLNALTSAITNLSTQNDGSVSLKASDVSSTSNQIDSDGNSVLDRSELITLMQNEVSFANAMYPDSDNSSYIVQRLVNAMYAYNGLA